MLKYVLEEEQTRIQKRAKKDKSGAYYLAELIRTNRELYEKAFENEEGFQEPELSRHLYQEAKRTIESLFDEHTTVIGIHTYHFNPEEPPKTPTVILRWEEFTKMFPGEEYDDVNKTIHLKVLTDEGREIMNRYLAARGLPSIEQQRKLRHERIFGKD